MAMKKLSLTVIERINTVHLLDQAPTRNTGESRMNMKLIDLLDLSSEEKEKYSLQEQRYNTSDGQGIISRSWNREIEQSAEIEFPQDLYGRLRAFFEALPGAPPAEMRQWRNEFLEKLDL